VWRITELAFNPARLDFTSSGQGFRDVTQASAGSARLANAIELTSWDEEPVQLEVCTSCGCVRCAPGGCASLRRTGRHVAVIPAFESMLGGDWPASQYSPPACMRSRGALLVELEPYELLRQRAPGLPEAKNLKPLRAREAVRVFQWEASEFLVGRFPDPVELRVSDVLATSEAGDADRVAEFRAMLADLAGSDRAVTLEECDPDLATVFYVDSPQVAECRAMVADQTGVRLFLEPGFVIKADL